MSVKLQSVRKTIFVYLLVTFLFATTVNAQQNPPRLEEALGQVVRIVDLIYAFGGTLFSFFGIIIGIQWMTSGSDPEKLQQIQSSISLWIIGFILFFLSATIVTTIYDVFGVYQCGDPNRGIVPPGFSYLFVNCS
jgi:hypothetical protein